SGNLQNAQAQPPARVTPRAPTWFNHQACTLGSSRSRRLTLGMSRISRYYPEPLGSTCSRRELVPIEEINATVDLPLGIVPQVHSPRRVLRRRWSRLRLLERRREVRRR